MVGLTSDEMLFEAKVMYESIASADAPGYDVRQWSIILTQAQEEVTLETIADGIGKDNKNKLILSPISKTKTIPLVSYSKFPNSYSVSPDISFNPLYIDSEFVSVDPEPSAAKPLIQVKPVELSFYGLNINNPYEKPDSTRQLWRVNSDNKTVIIGDGSQIGYYTAIYFERPAPIIATGMPAGKTIEGISTVSNCTLHQSVHRLIVAKAAKLANAYIGDVNKYQLIANETR